MCGNDNAGVFRGALICLLAVCSVTASAATIADLQHQRDTALQDCMAHLPANQSMAWQDSKGRGKFPPACREAKRLRDDARDIAKYRDDLMKMYGSISNPPATRAIAQQEADDIAMRMITTTRTLANKFNMVHSAILNNLLVNIGSKEGGQCYQWVRGLFAELPATPYQVFERTWGGSRVHKFLENNSVIFTVRGQDLQTGILYDAWRGRGNPWWRLVRKDHYPWSVRFTEAQILAGEAQVEGKAELNHPPKPHNP